jgi:nicotinate-nucleotide pyrophosphorylase (carboxylating)
MIEPLVRMALLEDLGQAGDLTTDAIVPLGHRATTFLVARQTGVVAGLDLARLAFQLINPAMEVRLERNDGAALAPRNVIATITGPARGILTAERVALNFLCRLSGITTATGSVVAAVRDTKAKIVCTRKTTPGLPSIERYAVRIRGGSNHRFALDDAVLIKDNHVPIAGSVTEALKRARNGVGHLIKIELEVDTLDQLREALDHGRCSASRQYGFSYAHGSSRDGRRPGDIRICRAAWRSGVRTKSGQCRDKCKRIALT